ncbi:hypothetical protein BDF20DRAFT_104013 [Mycotypha africana]|uniref:uncharacterized protein n=1 Tax=Mycotypha africana TaxID=64632 RepID=UPI0023008C7A|nr:uncharacterized protein BDF20DRAFT_104013 [Mycotypha africana]KAI8970104.1 hypothetical protein BDF20DRAFT_104013 [Mycotypha africana]
MGNFRYSFIFLITVLYLIASIDAKSSSWNFNNWNHYGKEVTVGRGSSWDKAWGIPSQSGWAWFWNGAEKLKNVAVKDPAGKDDLVLRVTYPAGSRNPDTRPRGGIGFRAQPIEINENVKTVDFQYSVYFPKGFKFIQGGKLPGLYGGHGDCTGGEESDSCFTTRIMWRKDGNGEIYAYLPHNQRKDICDEDNNICNDDYGYSLGRGEFKFETGQWNTVRQTITLNNAGKQDGKIELQVNGKKAITVEKLIFRENKAGRVAGILFHTFFGGSDSSWKTPKKQYTYFKDLHLSAK